MRPLGSFSDRKDRGVRSGTKSNSDHKSNTLVWACRRQPLGFCQGLLCKLAGDYREELRLEALHKHYGYSEQH